MLYKLHITYHNRFYLLKSLNSRNTIATDRRKIIFLSIIYQKCYYTFYNYYLCCIILSYIAIYLIYFLHNTYLFVKKKLLGVNF